MLLSEAQRRIFLVLPHAAVCRTDDLVRIDQLLQTVCAPADDTRDGEHRRIQLGRQTEHGIHEARIEIHVDRNALVDAALLGDRGRREALNIW